MAAATTPISTPERPGLSAQQDVAASTVIYAGTLVALDASGNAKPASNTANLRVIGIAQETVDNSAGAAGDLKILVKPGVFVVNNAGVNPVTKAHVGSVVYVSSDNEVALSGTNNVKAGVLRGFDATTGNPILDTTTGTF
jgi:uncharacterized lipoprotein NlpE involved in copper resistance